MRKKNELLHQRDKLPISLVTVGGTLVAGVQTNRNSTLRAKIANIGAQRAMLEVVVDKMSRGGRRPERVALLPAKGKNRRPMKAPGGSEYGREKILWKVGYRPVLIRFCTGEGTDNTRKGLLWGRISVRVLIGGVCQETWRSTLLCCYSKRLHEVDLPVDRVWGRCGVQWEQRIGVFLCLKRRGGGQ